MILAALALVFFAGPALLLLSGDRGRPLSGERLVKAPRPAQGWAFFDDATQYLTQTLPMRKPAIAINNWISRNVFDTTPRYGGNLPGSDLALPFGGVNANNANGGYAQTGGAKGGHPIVAVGRDGWLFLQGELDTLCSPPVGFATAVARWREFVDIIRSTGRKVVLLIAPEKSTIYPEYIAPRTISWPCAQRQKARLWSQIEALHNPGVVALRRPLLAMKHRDPRRLLYLPLDSHWNDIGALLVARDALRRVGGQAQISTGDIHAGIVRYTGDMTRFTGAVRTGLAPSETVQRAGAGPVTTTFKRLGMSITQTPGGAGPVIPKTTLFLHDSYGEAAVPMLQPYAARLVELTWLFTTPRQIVQLIRQSDTVILETIERDFLNRAAPGLMQAVLTPSFLKALPALLGPASPSP